MHLAIPVRNEACSRRFYETYFGFDAVPPERMSDGVLMLYDAAGFALALKETDETISLPGFLHFAFGSASDADEVRAFRDRLRRDGIPIVEEWEEPDYVSVKCRDPDGYVIEVAWEPDEDGWSRIRAAVSGGQPARPRRTARWRSTSGRRASLRAFLPS